MNKILLNEMYYRSEFRTMVEMSLAKEIIFLTSKPILEQSPEEKKAIAAYLQGDGFNTMIEKTSRIAIDDPAISTLGCYHELTDEIVGSVVTAIFQQKMAYLV